MKIILFKELSLFDDNLFDETIKMLPLSIKNHILKSKIKINQKKSMIGYLLLVKLLKEEKIFSRLPVYYYNENNKPYLENYQNVYFNISHSNNLIVACLSDKEIGIDIECISNIDDKLIRYTMNEDEYQTILNSKSISKSFFNFWTKKEAYIKLLGITIKKDIKNILNDSKLLFLTFSGDDFVINICQKGDN